MEPAAVPTSQRQRTSGGNTIGGGGACIGDLPDALLSLIFEGVQYTDWPAIVLTCPRWHRVLHATPSLWRWYSVSAPQMADRQWGTEQQEAWLAAKLRQLRRVSPAVECLTVVNTAGVDVLADMLNCLSPGRLAEIYASDYREPVTPAAMRALAGFGGLPQLEAVSIGSTIHALPANSSWAVGQLTALCSLCLHSSSFPADLPAMLCRLSDLEKLDITSRERLPDVQPLTALGQLRELALQEAWSQPQDGLAVLPATAFKSGTQLYFESTYLKAAELRLSAMTHTDTCAATLEECERSGSPRVRLDGLLLTADGAVPLLVSTLKPASSHIESLALTQCGLSEAAWLPAGHLHSITRLELQDCTNAVPGSSLTSVLDAALQQMSRLRSLQISDCDLSSGLPDALRQLRSIDDLYINDAQLASLPPLACMEGLECLDLDGNVFAEMPSLGSAPRLTTLRINQEFELVLDAASARRLAAEAPNLCHLSIGGPVAAGVWLAKQLPQLDVL